MAFSTSAARLRPIMTGGVLLGAALTAQTARAAVVPTPVTLQNATATFSQSGVDGVYNVSTTIDGTATGGRRLGDP